MRRNGSGPGDEAVIYTRALFAAIVSYSSFDSSLFLFICFEIGSCYIAQAGLELIRVLSLSLELWSFEPESPCLAFFFKSNVNILY